MKESGESGQRIILIPLFEATGARDGTTAATVVHCTNLEAASRTVYVDFFGFDGALDCGLSATILAGDTATFSTRPTSLYYDDEFCDPGPELNQGSIEVSVTQATRLICSAQVVDPANATPAYLTTLDLFRP